MSPPGRTVRRVLLSAGCPGCGGPGPALCAGCAAALTPAPGLPPPAGVDACVALLAYEGPGRRLLARLKYAQRAGRPPGPGGGAGGRRPARRRRRHLGAHHRARRRERGFDQAELLARAVARRLRLPVPPPAGAPAGPGPDRPLPGRAPHGAARRRFDLAAAPPGPAHGPPGRRRGDHRRHRLGRRRAPSPRRRDAVILLAAAARRRPGPFDPPGRRGRHPYTEGTLRTGLWLRVEASRRRNDPRKATRGRRAWCGLEVSPAACRDPISSARGEKEPSARQPVLPGPPRGAAGAGVRHLLGRRVWGQRPGQPCATLRGSRPGGSPVDVQVSARKVQLSPALRAAVETKLSRLDRFLRGEHRAEVHFLRGAQRAHRRQARRLRDHSSTAPATTSGPGWRPPTPSPPWTSP